MRYGGNTSCVEVRTDSGTLLVLDCGTGVRALGLQLLQDAADSGGRPPAGSILIGHTHWDHIHGLPFFAPLFVPGSRWDVFGPRGLMRNLDNVLAGQMEYQYFPIGLDEVNAEVHYHDLVEGVFEVGDATIRTQYLNHPALTLGFRIEADGATVVYASDHEPHDAALAGGTLPRLGTADARHADFLADADVRGARHPVRRRRLCGQGRLGPQHDGVRGRVWPEQPVFVGSCSTTTTRSVTTTGSTTCSAERVRWRPPTGLASRSMPPPRDPFSRFGARVGPERERRARRPRSCPP